MANFGLFSSIFSKNYIYVSVPDAMLIALFVYLICRFTIFRKKNAKKKKWLGFLFVYVGALAALTLFPLRKIDTLDIIIRDLGTHISRVQFVPLATIKQMWYNAVTSNHYTLMLYNLAGNFFMLMPLALIYPKIRGGVKAGKMLSTSFFVALSIEGYQLLGGIVGLCSRDVNIDDMLLNICGCMIFYFICRLFKWIK